MPVNEPTQPGMEITDVETLRILDSALILGATHVVTANINVKNDGALTDSLWRCICSEIAMKPHTLTYDDGAVKHLRWRILPDLDGGRIIWTDDGADALTYLFHAIEKVIRSACAQVRINRFDINLDLAVMEVRN